jgi:hypothetical protein
MTGDFIFEIFAAATIAQRVARFHSPVCMTRQSDMRESRRNAPGTSRLKELSKPRCLF